MLIDPFHCAEQDDGLMSNVNLNFATSLVEGLEEIDEEEKEVLGKEVFGHDKPWPERARWLTKF